MTLEATPKNIEWLFHRLYTERRNCEAPTGTRVTFVLLTKTRAEREVIETQFFHHVVRKYGVQQTVLQPEFSGKTSSLFFLPEVNAGIMLMDLEG